MAAMYVIVGSFLLIVFGNNDRVSGFLYKSLPYQLIIFVSVPHVGLVGSIGISAVYIWGLVAGTIETMNEHKLMAFARLRGNRKRRMRLRDRNEGYGESIGEGI